MASAERIHDDVFIDRDDPIPTASTAVLWNYANGTCSWGKCDRPFMRILGFLKSVSVQDQKVEKKQILDTLKTNVDSEELLTVFQTPLNQWELLAGTSKRFMDVAYKTMQIQRRTRRHAEEQKYKFSRVRRRREGKLDLSSPNKKKKKQAYQIVRRQNRRQRQDKKHQRRLDRMVVENRENASADTHNSMTLPKLPRVCELRNQNVVLFSVLEDRSEGVYNEPIVRFYDVFESDADVDEFLKSSQAQILCPKYHIISADMYEWLDVSNHDNIKQQNYSTDYLHNAVEGRKAKVQEAKTALAENKVDTNFIVHQEGGEVEVEPLNVEEVAAPDATPNSESETVTPFVL
tara:strand:+ start:21393 stop:22433 length:1041 start_codon:yes stop_codon:yes gene_type:complete